jgi:hypothetical protein
MVAVKPDLKIMEIYKKLAKMGKMGKNWHFGQNR